MIARSEQRVSDGVRVLVVLNERVAHGAIDWYRALERLEAEKHIDAWAVYPFLARRDAGVGESEMVKEIIGLSGDIGATVVLWAHFFGAEVSEGAVARIRTASVGVTMGYWDEDWYHFYRNPFPRETLRLCAKCDAAFVNGDGYLVRLLKSHGCCDVRFVPSTGDERFTAQPQRSQYDFDVVMIGSRISSRLPFRDMPGNVLRRRLVAAFSKRYGSRFGVFGFGWTGSNAMGSIPFASQSEIYGSATVALGNNNWFTPYYFSNRLPIAMQSGRPLVHAANDGYEEVFGADAGVGWFDSVDTALHLTDAMLVDPQAASVSADQAQRLAEDRFTSYHALRYMIDVLSSKQSARGGAPKTIANPWISRERL